MAMLVAVLVGIGRDSNSDEYLLKMWRGDNIDRMYSDADIDIQCVLLHAPTPRARIVATAVHFRCVFAII